MKIRNLKRLEKKEVDKEVSVFQQDSFKKYQIIFGFWPAYRMN
jgi:hypothetical protein